jgi:DNA invertase Pin-like site-specific DNA recombinase
MKRVGIYLRVSTTDQSTEIQIKDLMSYSELRGWKVSGVFEDKMTGTHINRPNFKLLMDQCRQRQIDIVLVYKLDRAFRSLRDTVNTLHELGELGVEFISLRDPGLDMTTSMGKLMIHIVAAFAAFEADIIKARVRAGLDHAKSKGKTLGRPRVVNVDLVRQLRREGKSLSQIAKALNTTKGCVSKTLKKFGS